MKKKKVFDSAKIEEAVKMMFEAIGENPKRAGIKKTPERVARAFEEIFEGCKYTNKEIARANRVLFKAPSDGLVVEKISGPRYQFDVRTSFAPDV